MASTDAQRADSKLEAPSLAFAAIIVAAGFLGSRLLGLLRSVIIAQAFGTRPELDAYWVAFRLPDLVFQLLAGATLASAFIPTFANVRARQGDAAAWRLASSVLNLVLLATIIFAVVAFIFAGQLVPLLAPGLGKDSGNQAELQGLATNLTRLMLISPILFAVSGMFMGILNARRHFLTPALAPMFYNLSIIIAAIATKDVHYLAWGVVIGAALHLAIQLPDLKSIGMTYRIVADWRDAAVREVGALMAPRVLGLAATQINFYFIAIFFASNLGDGAISALSFAWLITMTPLGVIGMAISTAAFPTMAEQAASGDSRLAATIQRSLRLILFLSLPAGIGLAVLAKPLIVVLLQHGAFNTSSTDLTAQALLFYAPALFAHSGIEILSRGFYALGDTKTPVAVAVGAMLINLVLAALLVGPLELRGLALALSIATTLEFLTLSLRASRRIDGLLHGQLMPALGSMVIAMAATGATAGGSLFLINYGLGVHANSLATGLFTLVIPAGIGGLTYFAMAVLFHLDETQVLIDRIPARLRRSRA